MFDPILAAKTLDQAVSAGTISVHTCHVGRTLLFRCRQPGAELAKISLTRLARLAGVGRTVVVKAIRELRTVGLLLREKTRVRIVWALGVASRQGCNVYRWLVRQDTEVATRPVDSKPASFLRKPVAHGRRNDASDNNAGGYRCEAAGRIQSSRPGHTSLGSRCDRPTERLGAVVPARDGTIDQGNRTAPDAVSKTGGNAQADRQQAADPVRAILRRRLWPASVSRGGAQPKIQPPRFTVAEQLALLREG